MQELWIPCTRNSRRRCLRTVTRCVLPQVIKPLNLDRNPYMHLARRQQQQEVTDAVICIRKKAA